MCLAPRQAWIATQSFPTEYYAEWTPVGYLLPTDYGGEYKRRLYFREPKLLPYRREVVIPCRKCFECVQSYSTNWAVRCCLEAKMHEKNCFITLTYDEQHIEDLSKKTLQKFIKRLRKHFGVKSCRYFACGEYGENTGRPHYHLILFGVDFSEDRYFLKRDRRGNPIYCSDILSRLWKFGFHSIGDISFSSAKYCAKYMQKFNFANGKKAFTLQSRKPAIGYDFAVKNAESLCRSGKVYIDGKEYNIPWQFKRWFQKSVRLVSFSLQLDSLKKCVSHSFKKVYQLAVDRRKQIIKRFGFWNIKSKFKKEFNKIQC